MDLTNGVTNNDHAKATAMDKIDKTEMISDPDFGQFAVQYPSEVGIVDKHSGIWPDTAGKMYEGKPLVVVLFGWGGAQDKHLAKYSDIYLSRGCIIVRYTAPGKVVMLNHDQLPGLAAKFLNILIKLELDTHPLFFHLFSNGGGFTYSYLLAEISVGHKHLDIRGTIFDSAPAPREVGAYFRALLAIFESYGGIRYVMAACMVILLVLSVFMMHLKKFVHFLVHGDKIGIERGHPSHNWLSRISEYRNHNFLFIYSDTDDIIRSHHVEEFAKYLEEERDNHVDRLKFTDSLHVLHYRKYPKEYEEALIKFIRKVMNEENRSQYPTQY